MIKPNRLKEVREQNMYVRKQQTIYALNNTRGTCFTVAVFIITEYLFVNEHPSIVG